MDLPDAFQAPQLHIGQDLENQNSCTLVEMKTAQLPWERVWQFPDSSVTQLPSDPAVLLMHIFPREIKISVPMKTCSRMLTAALFIITKRQKQPKHPSADEWTPNKVLSIPWNIIQQF